MVATPYEWNRVYKAIMGPLGMVGYLSNELGIHELGIHELKISVESSLQGIKLVGVRLKQLITRNPNVILTQQTCSQRSNMPEGSQRREVPYYCFMRIWYRFPVSKHREA